MSQRDQVGAPLSDCARQRNLTDEGRADARRISEVFRARRIPVGKVLSSAYCRCLETAQLGFGSAEAWLPLQFALRNARGPGRADGADPHDRQRASGGGNLILVTHQLTIRAVTGVAVAEGEMLVVTPRGGAQFEIAGRIPTEDLSDP